MQIAECFRRLCNKTLTPNVVYSRGHFGSSRLWIRKNRPCETQERPFLRVRASSAGKLLAKGGQPLNARTRTKLLLGNTFRKISAHIIPVFGNPSSAGPKPCRI
jgi:hypothetical protein